MTTIDGEIRKHLEEARRHVRLAMHETTKERHCRPMMERLITVLSTIDEQLATLEKRKGAS